MTKHSKKKKDLILGIISVCFAAFIFYTALGMPKTKYAGDPGPALMPMLGSVVMAVFGIALVVHPSEDAEAVLSGRHQWLAAAKMFGLYVAFALMLWLLGFTVATPVTIFITTFMMSKLSAKESSVKKRIVKSLIFAVISSACLYLMYIVGLSANLPRGVLWRLI